MLSNDTVYTCYCILGKAENEEDLLYGKENWMKLYQVFDDFLKKEDLVASVVSYQSMCRIKKIDKKGNWHVTFRNVATGGVQKWSEKANKKLFSQQMEDDFKLKKELAAQGLTVEKYLSENFPEKDSYFVFNESMIYAYLDKDVNVRHQPQGDIHFYLKPPRMPNNKLWNQEIVILVSDELLNKSTETVIEKLINDIAALTNPQKIYKANFKAAKVVNSYGMDSITAVFGRRFGQHNTLNLTKRYTDLQLSKWKEL